MIRILFFDMGETLIHQGKPFPGVLDALKTISELNTADGSPVEMAVVSDYFMPDSPVTEEKIRGLEKQYRETVMDPAGLTAFFSPFESRVTLSSRAGIRKPDKAVFNAALARLKTTAALSECIFVTEAKEHLEKAKEYGMTPVGFGASGPGIATFTDWMNAPLLVAELLAPADLENLALSAAPELDKRHGISSFKPARIEERTLHGRASQLFQLRDSALGELDGVYVERPTDVLVELGAGGRLAQVKATPPDSEEVADAVNYVHSLIQSGQIETHGESKRTTHVVEKDASGRVRLIRRRFSTY